MSRTILASVLLAACLTTVAEAQTVDVVVHHSGYLLDGADVPVTSASVPLTFRLYEQETPAVGVAPIWSASCAVAVHQGRYAVALGGSNCGTALSTAQVPPSAARYLEVSVGSVTLLPRVVLRPVPSATVASLALDSMKLGGVAAAALVDGSSGKLLATAFPTGGITNDHVAATAGITVSKIAGLGSLASKNAVSDADITGLSASKVTGLGTLASKNTVSDIDITGLSAAKVTGLGTLASKNTISDLDIGSGAGIAVSKLSTGNNGQILTMSGGVPVWGAAPSTLAFTPVNKAGDTMSGGLGLPSNGLTVGATQLVVTGGNVGIGTASPAAALSVSGGIQLGNDTVCSAAKSGTLRWTGTAVEVCSGTAWTPIYKAPIVTSGGTVTDGGTHRLHTFTASGTFTTQSALTADVLVVGGGGSGGSNNGGGGGGGGVRYVTSFSIPAGSYAVTVGAGAPAITSSGYSGTQGGSSTFSTITSVGGGGGTGGNYTCGTSGGSGGGDARGRCGAQAGTSGQGNSGASNPSGNVGGGGGGAGGAGSSRNGGAGLACSITGSSVVYGGGGGGGAEDGSAYGGDGGSGGGGQGGGTSRRSGVSGTNGLGGGGGGDVNGDAPTGAGGSGVVIIRFPI